MTPPPMSIETNQLAMSVGTPRRTHDAFRIDLLTESNARVISQNVVKRSVPISWAWERRLVTWRMADSVPRPGRKPCCSPARTPDCSQMRWILRRGMMVQILRRHSVSMMGRMWSRELESGTLGTAARTRHCHQSGTAFEGQRRTRVSKISRKTGSGVFLSMLYESPEMPAEDPAEEAQIADQNSPKVGASVSASRIFSCAQAIPGWVYGALTAFQRMSDR